MKARDIFGIVIRTVGVVLLLFGFWYLQFAVAHAFGLPQERSDDMVSYFMMGVATVLLGIVALRFARQIVSFSYPGDRDDSDHAA